MDTKNIFQNEKLKKYCEELKSKINLNNKVLLINPLQFNIDNFEIEVARNRGYYAYPPTGLQCLMNALDGRGLNIEILDLNYEFLKKINSDDSFDAKKWMEIVINKIEKNKYSIIGISSFFNVDSFYFSEIGKYMMEKGNTIVLAGGPNATYNSIKFLKQGICHFVLERESENKINYLFDNLYEDKKTKPTPGILFSYKGNIERTDGEKDIVELKGNLIKSYEKIPIEDYCKIGSLSPYSRMAGIDTPFSGILLNRGCRGNCKFCDVGDFMGRNLRSRNPQDFLDELEYLFKKRGIKYFEFLDDDFTRNKNLLLEVLNGIIKRNIKIKWASNNGFIASTIDNDIMEALRYSGCIGFKVGVESGNQDILKDIRKPGTLDTFRKFSSVAQNFPEIFIVDNYIIGFPDETFSQIKNSIKFSFEMNLDWSSFALYQQNVGSSENGTRDMNKIGDFIPSKDFKKGKIKIKEEEIEGMNIFSIPDEEIPSREMLKEIWFTFTILRNYINNKNLLNGNTDKFILWTKTIEERYPTHPYINLYLALAYNLIFNRKNSEEQFKKMTKNMKDKYWTDKIKLFKFDKIIENFPKTIEETKEAIEFLKRENEWK